MAKFTQDIDPAELVIRVSTKEITHKGEDGAVTKESFPALDVSTRRGVAICRAVRLDDASMVDFVAELAEVLRPFGFESAPPAGSMRERLAEAEAEVSRLGGELVMLKSELDARRAQALEGGGIPDASELPAMAQKVTDGDLGQADAFVAGVLEHAGRFGSHVSEQVERVCDFAARELAGLLKDAPTPTADEVPRPTPPPVAPPAPPAPPIGRRPIQGRSELTAAQKRNVDALAAKAGKPPAPLEPPSPRLADMAARIQRGDMLEIAELREFVELCKTSELNEVTAKAYAEAQDHLSSLEG